jgi:hypothetical protein
MKRWAPFAVAFALSMRSLLTQELPRDGESFEVEPPLLIDPDGRLPARDASAEPTPINAPDLEQLAQKLERAKKSEASAERLVKIGVLAKIEAEQRALRVVRLQAELANAQLAEMKRQIASQQSGAVQVGQIAESNLAVTEAQLGQAATAAETAAANLQQAELEAALLNLHRQQKLLALGSARKSDVARAEEKLAALKRELK